MSLLRLIQRERAARGQDASGAVLLFLDDVGADDGITYADALASGRVARAAGVIRVHFVDPSRPPFTGSMALQQPAEMRT